MLLNSGRPSPLDGIIESEYWTCDKADADVMVIFAERVAGPIGS